MSNKGIEARVHSDDFDCERMRVVAFHGREAISSVSGFEIEVAVEPSHLLDVGQLIGAAASVTLSSAGEELRVFHGIIVEVEDRLEADVPYRSYLLKLVPRASRAGLVRSHEVFLNLTVPEIIRQKLELVGIPAAEIEMRLTGTYAPRDFVVQFDETDLAFLGRLAEHAGIAMFFEHHGGHDKIVFTDHLSGFAPLPSRARIPFARNAWQNDIASIRVTTRAIPRFYIVRDYDYRAPMLDLTAKAESPHGLGGGFVEIGTHHRTTEEGERLARNRAQEAEANQRVFVGTSGTPELSAGARFTIEGHPHLNHELLITEVEHHAMFPFDFAEARSDEIGYRGVFHAVEAARGYRPARVTPRPRIHGIITAFTEPDLTGQGRSIARIDAQGRYTVRFTFDAAGGEGSGPSSKPIRMVQFHAGASYGSHFPLKPGIEVVIAFVGGDPDRPVILGAIPNALTPSPVNAVSPLSHKIVTASGISLTMHDEPT